MDDDPQRHCSVPDILGFRTWFEKHHGNICKRHDEAYIKEQCRVCADLDFLHDMVLYWRWKNWMVMGAVMVAVPFIFIGFQINTLVQYIRGKV